MKTEDVLLRLFFFFFWYNLLFIEGNLVEILVAYMICDIFKIHIGTKKSLSNLVRHYI